MRFATAIVVSRDSHSNCSKFLFTSAGGGSAGGLGKKIYSWQKFLLADVLNQSLRPVQSPIDWLLGGGSHWKTFLHFVPK
jgi:hypothetical protein